MQIKRKEYVVFATYMFKMKIKLPVYFPPISDSYSADASIAAVLQAYDVYNPDLFLNRLYLFRKPNNVIKFATIQKNFNYEFSSFNDIDIVDYICKEIIQNKYIFLFLDHFYINGSECYLKKHFMHDFCFIYGFDSEEEVFYCADNFIRGKYSKLKVSFKDLVAARQATIESDVFMNNKNIVSFTYNGPQYILNNSIIFSILDEYLNSSFTKVMELNPSFLTDNIFGFSHGQNCQIDNCVFGIDIYNCLREEIKKIVDNKIDIDIRPFPLLCNHQAILKHLIIYWNRQGILDQKRFDKKIENQITNCFILRNLVIKYNIIHKNEIGENIIKRLNMIEKEERNFFEEILNIEK